MIERFVGLLGYVPFSTSCALRGEHRACNLYILAICIQVSLFLETNGYNAVSCRLHLVPGYAAIDAANEMFVFISFVPSFRAACSNEKGMALKVLLYLFYERRDLSSCIVVFSRRFEPLVPYYR